MFLRIYALVITIAILALFLVKRYGILSSRNSTEEPTLLAITIPTFIQRILFLPPDNYRVSAVIVIIALFEEILSFIAIVMFLLYLTINAPFWEYTVVHAYVFFSGWIIVILFFSLYIILRKHGRNKTR